MIAIIDYGVGNLGSILNMLKKLKIEAEIISDIGTIENADKIILPGVGSFDNGMRNLNERGFVPILNKLAIEEKKPILGICLGMQLFSKSSEEGKFPGLGWLDAETVRFKFDGENTRLKIPHMGWNRVDIKNHDAIFKDMYPRARYYFVHSLHVKCNDPANVLTITHYGFDFVSAVQKDNILGTQFHPEKSHKFGMKLLKNFGRL